MTEPRIGIIGCGLIGGSIGLALKRNRTAATISCLDLRENLGAITESGFADFVGTLDDAPQMLPNCEVVILATPVEVILELLPRIAPHLTAGTVVTDVGGTKQAITEQAGRVLSADIVFIGGHPIAGSENAGIGAADPLLFKDRVYALCPRPDTPAPALLTLLDIVEDLRAVPLTIEPDEHDRILAMVSHLPQLLSIALVHAAMEADSFHSMLEMTAGRGFLDLTRIAASGFDQWEGVLKTNREAIAHALDRLERSVRTVRQALDDDDLAPLWSAVSDKRRTMTAQSRPLKRKPDLRLLIDACDERLLKALSDRLRAVDRMGQLKADASAPVYDPDRERRLFTARREWGKTLGIPDALIDGLFEVIVDHSKKLQRK